MAAKQKVSAEEAGTGRGTQGVELAAHGRRCTMRAKAKVLAVFMPVTGSLENLAGEHQSIWKSDTNAKVKPKLVR